MARYIDADALMKEVKRIGGHNLCGWETIGVKALIERQPTADVVPSAEVERLQHILDCYALQYGTVKDQQSAIDKAKAETEREIGEEIYRIIGDGDNETWICLLIRELADKLVKGGDTDD